MCNNIHGGYKLMLFIIQIHQKYIGRKAGPNFDYKFW